MKKIMKWLGNLSKRKIFFLLILFVALLVIIFVYKDHGITWDEGNQRTRGDLSYKYYASLGKDKTYFSQPKENYIAHGLIIELASELIMTLSKNYSPDIFHLILGIFSLLGLVFIYKSINILINNKRLACFGAILIFFTPKYFGHAFNNSKDLPVVYILAAFIYYSLKILKNKNKLVDYFILGLLLAFGISLRIIFIYAYFLFVFFDILKIIINNKKLSIISLVKKNGLIIFISLIVFHIINPYLHIKPITGILDIIYYSTRYPWTGLVLFEGKMIRSFQLPWYYIPKWIIISTPIITLLFLSVGVIKLISTINNIKLLKKYFLDFYILSLLFTPLILIIILKPTVYDGWRHFLFLITPMTIICIRGLNVLATSKIKIVKKIALILFAINIIITGYRMIRLHPYQYVYFNELIGSMKNADGQYEIDYWGKSFKEAIEWLKENKLKNVKRIVNVNTCSFTHYTAYYFSSNMKRVEDLNNAEYFICFNRSRLDKIVSDDKTIHIIEREGLPLNYIKKL